MKKVLSLIISGVFGGVLVLAAIWMFADKILPQTEAEAPIYSRMTGNTGSSTAPFDFTVAADRAMDAVVHIKASESKQAVQERGQQQRRSPFSFFFDDELMFGNPYGGPRQGSGSGVIVDTDGYIVTNNHVIAFADEYEVTTHDNRKFTARLIGRDENTDIAVLKIEASNLKPIVWGNSDNLKVGQWVVAVGNPFDLTSTVTAGIVSAKGRKLELNRSIGAIEAFIQTDAAVNPGNSGGALVDTEGRLVGINTAIASQTGNFAGYSFAIPSDIVSKIVEDIIEYGSFQRAYLGVGIFDNDSDSAEELGITQTTGVVIKEVYDGGSAQYAGLLPNDVIMKVNTKEVRNVPQLQELISRSKVGEVIQLTVLRKGKEKNIDVKLRSAS
jgi:serine protease Do